MKRLLFFDRPCLAAIATAGLLMPCCINLPHAIAYKAQDNTDKATSAVQEKEDAEPDPFAVPDGDVQVLVEHITRMARMRITGTTPEERLDNHMKRLVSVVEACDRIFGANPEEKDELFAFENQFGALSAMGTRGSEEMKQKLNDLLARMEQDKRPQVARIPAAARLRDSVSQALRAGTDERQASVDMLIAHIDRFGVDGQVVSIASSLGRALSANGESEQAAGLYQSLGETMAKSDEPQIVAYAEKMFGAARFAKLPGHFMELSGRIADGSTFDWSKYRGKVVLVDFWASWCGPCLGELPNMKANLARYQDKGFTIVGINLDKSRDAFEKCIAEKEITWENIMGEEGEGWDNPMATHYGISAIPTAILVDKEGNVLSLSARGTKLDELLAEQFGASESSE